MFTAGLQLSFASLIGRRPNRCLDFKELRGLLAGDRVLAAPAFGPVPANRNLQGFRDPRPSDHFGARRHCAGRDLLKGPTPLTRKLF
jgi:hypothetical protein